MLRYRIICQSGLCRPWIGRWSNLVDDVAIVASLGFVTIGWWYRLGKYDE